MTGLVRGDARRITLRDGCVQAVVTSPPYWGLRDYNAGGQIGLEPTPDAFVAAVVAVFREVWRVLRDDGVCWLNLGDSYASLGRSARKDSPGVRAPQAIGPVVRDVIWLPRHGGDGKFRWQLPGGIKPKDLIGIPYLVVAALRSDGWYWRQTVIWVKRSPMPESVSDRPTGAFEPVFLLAKSPRYFFDWYAGARPSRYGTDVVLDPGWKLLSRARNVWVLSSEPVRASHFATMPTALAERCLRLSTPEAGCCAACGAPRERVVGRMRFPTRPGKDSKVYVDPKGSPYARHNGSVVGNRDPKRHVTAYRHEGWKPTCACGTAETRPAMVLDPFVGSGTTGVVARSLGRDFVGLDLNADYLAMARGRIAAPDRPARGKGAKAAAPLPGQLSLFPDDGPGEPDQGRRKGEAVVPADGCPPGAFIARDRRGDLTPDNSATARAADSPAAARGAPGGDEPPGAD